MRPIWAVVVAVLPVSCGHPVPSSVRLDELRHCPPAPSLSRAGIGLASRFIRDRQAFVIELANRSGRTLHLRGCSIHLAVGRCGKPLGRCHIIPWTEAGTLTPGQVVTTVAKVPPAALLGCAVLVPSVVAVVEGTTGCEDVGVYTTTGEGTVR